MGGDWGVAGLAPHLGVGAYWRAAMSALRAAIRLAARAMSATSCRHTPRQ
jgi:hypothetical protein